MFKWTVSLPAVTSFLFFALMPPATLGADVSKYRELQTRLRLADGRETGVFILAASSRRTDPRVAGRMIQMGFARTSTKRKT
jgi:hypothetical protein